MSSRSWALVQRSASAPGATDYAEVDDLWEDMSTHVLKRCSSIDPYTWIQVGGGGGGIAPPRPVTKSVGSNTSTTDEKAQDDATAPGTSDETTINLNLGTNYLTQLLSGQFDIDGSITGAYTNQHLKGYGLGTKIFLEANSDCNMITIGGDGWTISDLSTDGNKANQGAGSWNVIYNISKDDMTVSHCVFEDHDDAALRLGGTLDNIKVHHSDFRDMGGCALYNYGTVKQLKFDHCIIDDGDSGSMFLVDGNGQYNAEDILVHGCSLLTKAGYLGLEFVDTQHATVAECFFDLPLTGTGQNTAYRFYQSQLCLGIGNQIHETDDSGASINRSSLCAVVGDIITGTGSSAIGLTAVAGAHDDCHDNLISSILAYNCGQSADKDLTRMMQDIHDILVVGTMAVQIGMSTNYFDHHFYVHATSTGDNAVFVANKGRAMDLAMVTMLGSGSDHLYGLNHCDEIPIGYHLDGGNDIFMVGSYLTGCTTTAIDINNGSVVRPVILCNSFQGSTAGITGLGTAVDARVALNIDIAGNWDVNSDIWIPRVVRVKHDDQNPAIASIPAGSFVKISGYVITAFNSDGTDTITGGYDADTDSLFTSIDVSGTGKLSLTEGTEGYYMATARDLELYYVNGGTEPNAGEAVFLFEVCRAPA